MAEKQAVQQKLLEMIPTYGKNYGSSIDATQIEEYKKLSQSAESTLKLIV